MGRGWFGVVKFRIAKFIQPEKNCGDRAVLVAISIPIFTSQLEKSREAVDAANLRSAYAECAAEILTVDSATTKIVYKQVDPKQTTSGWVSKPDEIGTVKAENIPDIVSGTPVYVVLTLGTNDVATATITTTEPTAGSTVKELS